MAPVVNRVFDEALTLPANARMSLVDKLLASLNLPIQPEIERLWADEAERRVSQTDQGEVELISGEEVFSRVRKKYKR
jgi:putative addiction module component (TIGR02574 family)